VGISSARVSFLEVLLAFAVGQLVGAIPITPGGLGTADAALIGMLIAFGASSSDALAADMVWRAATYFPPIIIGTVTFLLWKRDRAKHPVSARPEAVTG
jgi:putative heme transporter